MPSDQQLSNTALTLISIFDDKNHEKDDEKVTVNPLISKVASVYEKFRTSMDYGSEETVPRRAIERMLKRMLFLDIKSKKVGTDLVRELVWAGYFPNESVSESTIEDVSKTIELYLKLKTRLSEKKILKRDELNHFIMETLSCEILYMLFPNKTREAYINFIFKNLRNSINILDDSEETKDVQIYLAIRKSFAKDDPASLKYHLFIQIFGKLTDENLEDTISEFDERFKQIKQHLSYPKKERILNHVKRKTPPFFILYDLLTTEKVNLKEISKDDDSLKNLVYETCEFKYKSIRRKVQTAIVRSFVFILFTKVVFTVLVEGTFETIFYGEIRWLSIILNSVIPPTLMVLAGVSITTPGKSNTKSIHDDIKKLLYENDPIIVNPINIKLKSAGGKSVSDYIFSTLWLLSIVLTFGGTWYVLGLLDFNYLSKSIFLFFVAIISFLSYRIYQTANSYTVIKKPSIFTPFFDFLFVPIIRLGRSLTEGISQVNFLILLIDFLIETPFKGIMGFFEQWFLFAANKREELE